MPVLNKQSVLSTEFLFAVVALVCATVLLATSTIDQETWKWVLTTVGGAYVLGRSAVKAVASGGSAQVANLKADLNTLAAATPPPDTTTNITNVSAAPRGRKRT